MIENKFRKVLESAISGSKTDIERLLKIYRPLIDGYSYLNGVTDEDLRQYIVMHIIKNIHKFKI